VIVRILKIIIPLAFLGAGAYGVLRLIETRPVVETKPAEKVIPTVRVIPVMKEEVNLTVYSQGTVSPRTVTELVPEVAGRVTFVSPSLAAGGFFDEGEVLLKIDRYDYELALIRARSDVAQAQVRLEQEVAESEVAAKEWDELGRGDEASPLVLRKPQLAQAEAALQAARAALSQAERDLDRTNIVAPFVGRVRTKHVDIGQFVSRGIAVAQLYSVDVAEVRLPLPDEELAFVDIPLSYRGDRAKRRGPAVLLKAIFAGKEHTWKGRIVRTEGEIDASTRMLYAVAEVSDPYGRGADRNRPPLAVGMFVEAEIRGDSVKDVIILPRAAIRGSDMVYVIDADNNLRFREVEVFRREKTRVILISGLEEGELVCVSPLETVVDGMPVRAIPSEEVLP